MQVLMDIIAELKLRSATRNTEGTLMLRHTVSSKLQNSQRKKLMNI